MVRKLARHQVFPRLAPVRHLTHLFFAKPSRVLLSGILLLGVASWEESTAFAAPTQAVALDTLEKAHDGKPEVHLDQFSFPQNIQNAKEFEAHLKRALKREAYRADWGAGRENRIEYRFEVTELKFILDEGALRIHCEAVGKLPGGRSAKSELSFGGHPGERKELTKQVLGIVARGVITRLAELERRRRGLR